MMFLYMYCDTSQAPINYIANIAFEEISVTVEPNMAGKVRDKHYWDDELVIAKRACLHKDFVS